MKMRREIQTFKLLHIDMVTFDPLKFTSKGNFIPQTILFHKKGEEHRPLQITWDDLLTKHCRIKEDEQEIQRREKGWFIVFCCFFINLLVLGFFKSLGMLLIEFKKDFNATLADVSVIVCVTYSLNSIAGPLACFMVVKYSPRSVAFTGTVMISTGLILSYFATSIVHLCFTVGVLAGFGSGLTYSPGLILVGSYFSKGRGIANGFVVSGSPVGGMVLPYTLSFLINAVGCRGALLILGGIMLNSCICALAFENPFKIETPTLKIYKAPKRTSTIVSKREFPLSRPSFKEEKTSNIRRSMNRDIRNRNGSSTIYATTTSSQSVADSKIREVYGRQNLPSSNTPVEIPKMYLGSNTVYGEKPWGPYQSYFRKSEINKGNGRICSRTPRTCSPVKISSPYRTIARKVTKEPSNHLIPPYVIALDHSCVALLSKESLNRCRKKPIYNTKQNKLQKVPEETRKVPHKAKLLLKDDNDNLQYAEDCEDDREGPNKSEDKDNGESPEEKTTKCNCGNWCYKYWCKNNRYFSLSAIKVVMRNPWYIILLLANATPAIGTTNVFLLIPSFAKHLGMSRDDYSNIYLMVSLFDLMGRLLGTYLSDKGVFRSQTVYATGLLVAGIFSMFMGTCTDYKSLVSVSCVFGFATGLHIGILGVLLQEIVGTEMLPAGYAFSMILNGILVLIGPYVCGYVLSQHPGFYWPLYTVFGIILSCGAMLWFIPRCKPKIKGPIDDDGDDANSEVNLSESEESLEYD